MLIPYLLTSIISASGFYVGKFVAKMAHEEIEPGQRHFIISRRIILALFLSIALYFNYGLVFSVISGLLGVFLPTGIAYILFSIGFFLNWNNPFFIYVSALIFVYGLVDATLKKRLYDPILFFVISLILFLFI